MDGSCALGLALGHVRNAAAAFVAEQDDSGESLFLAGECLELEGLFADFDVTPVAVDAGLGGVESLPPGLTRPICVRRSSRLSARLSLTP